MCEMGLISSQTAGVFSEELQAFFLRSQDSQNTDGWGIAKYGCVSNHPLYCTDFLKSTTTHASKLTEVLHPLLQLYKKPSNASTDIRCRFTCELPIPSNICLVHIRQMSKGEPDCDNTHPFYRQCNEQDWTFIHNGTVEYRGWSNPKRAFGSFRPYGNTDSEKIFCTLLHAIELAKLKGQRLDDLSVLTSVISSITAKICRGKSKGSTVTGTMNYILSNGEYSFQFCNREDSLYRKTDVKHRVIQIFTKPLDSLDASWEHVELGSLNIYKDGSLIKTISNVIRKDEIVSSEAEGTDYQLPSNY